MDVAEAIFWICDDKSKYISGVNLKIDGGGSLQEQVKSIEKFSEEI